MKKKILTGINALIAAILGSMGLTSCFSTDYGVDPTYGDPYEDMYGCPYATLDVSGTITDSEAQPVENIQVSVRLNPNPEAGKIPMAVSAENGTYEGELDGIVPVQTATLYAEDTTGVYATDSAIVELEYDNSQVSPSNPWNDGTATVKQDFLVEKE